MTILNGSEKPYTLLTYCYQRYIVSFKASQKSYYGGVSINTILNSSLFSKSDPLHPIQKNRHMAGFGLVGMTGLEPAAHTYDYQSFISYQRTSSPNGSPLC
ncbi:MAG TPA: hypothetical protein DCG19_04185 [Cryomorphaceae bacterium]|nr:hypothetical protein [Owenweeksia sp.]MBF99611.1 hypothetical protein [Owenweeksia sp.]HAD96580.1 hypothetical protein [Cryomorphaceae bacterium]HBF21678.1 hypothetical protein [Cryomorphaceae bacterium]HCQ15788.1 hypothetical protein [Cryomorphaceae bacterium]